MTDYIWAGRVLAPGGIINRGVVRIVDGRIAEVTDRESYQGRMDHDFGNRLIAPGFIDIHNHGAVGHHFMTSDAAGIRQALRYHMRHGTTSLLATTTTASEREIAGGLRGLEEVIKQQQGQIAQWGATVLGAHIEGPYLNPTRSGGQNSTHLRQPNVVEYRGWESSGLVRMITLAPEMAQAQQLVRYISENSKVLVSAGHTDASGEVMREAITWGLSHCTHFTNAMSGFTECEPGVFEPGVVGAGLLYSELTVEVIADGTHVHPDILRLIYQVKGADHVCLITDAVPYCGLPDGVYTRSATDDRQVQVRDGIVRLKANQVLAGSGLTMNRAAKRMASLGVPLNDVWKMASATPARLLGLADRKGQVSEGMDADLIIVDDSFEVHRVMIAGQIMDIAEDEVL